MLNLTVYQSQFKTFLAQLRRSIFRNMRKLPFGNSQVEMAAFCAIWSLSPDMATVVQLYDRKPTTILDVALKLRRKGVQLPEHNDEASLVIQQLDWEAA